MSGGIMPAGSGRALRLDPFALPARYAAVDTRADGQQREVELHRERVIVRRAVRGMRMAVNLPLSSFAGVALRVMAPQDGAKAAVALVLEHEDPSLALPLLVSEDTADVLAQWQSWSSVLGVPRIVEDVEGGWREPAEPQPAVQAYPRRRRRNALKSRRPSILMRRRPGALSGSSPVHRGEREIIARN